MAKYLFHSSLSPVTPSRAIQYDEALSLAVEGHHVDFLYCNGLMSQCFCNMTGNRAICVLCKANYRKESEMFGDKLNFIPMTSLVSDEQSKKVRCTDFKYDTVSEIKQILYDGIHIGEAALSGYISYTRNMDPLVDRSFHEFFDENMRNGILTAIAVQNTIDNTHYDKIWLYNGRFAENRPVWEVAKKNGITFVALEAVYGLNRNFKLRTINTTPHSITANNEMIKSEWARNLDTLEEKIRIGSSFFERRRQALYTGDKIYISGQQEGLLPHWWDSSKRNIVIFNSSEDEFASVGEEFDRYALFPSQLEGLRFIKAAFAGREDVNITLRIHPNLSNIGYSYATDLHKFDGGNFHIIEGASPISSYALLDAADTVVVFGSTIGIEAVYSGKPTILLAGAVYALLGGCYVPDSTDKLLEMLSKDLLPKDKMAAIQFGYFLLNEHKDYYVHLDYDWNYWNIRLPGINRRLELSNWQRTLNSRKLFLVLRFIRKSCLRLYYKAMGKSDKFVVPAVERQAL